MVKWIGVRLIHKDDCRVFRLVEMREANGILKVKVHPTYDPEDLYVFEAKDCKLV